VPSTWATALGAWPGGVTITAGLGYTSPIWAGAGITVLGLGVMAFAAANAKRNDAGRTVGPRVVDAGGSRQDGAELQRA
jgi:DHA1 family inner membrane transport protein